MTKKTAIRKMRSGRIFTVEFIKRTDNTRRRLNGRCGVTKYLKGGSLPFNPKDYDLLIVFDLQKMEYRSVNLRQLISLNGKKIKA